jgi:hypothetical protein
VLKYGNAAALAAQALSSMRISFVALRVAQTAEQINLPSFLLH